MPSCIAGDESSEVVRLRQVMMVAGLEEVAFILVRRPCRALSCSSGPGILSSGLLCVLVSNRFLAILQPKRDAAEQLRGFYLQGTTALLAHENQQKMLKPPAVL